MDKKYPALEKTYEYDKEKAEVFAEAVQEIHELDARRVYLARLLKDNGKLSKFVWTTVDKKVIALHKLEDDHLKNIMNHLMIRGVDISGPMKAEAVSRGFTVPDQNSLKNMAIEATIVPEGANEWPF